MKDVAQAVTVQFLKDYAAERRLALYDDCDLANLLPDLEDRRAFALEMALYFQDKPEQQRLQSDQQYDPRLTKDWKVAEYLAVQITTQLRGA